MSKNCPESEENIPLNIKGSMNGTPPVHRTNVIDKFCWHCFHRHKHGVYKTDYQVDWFNGNVQYTCSACGYTVSK